MKKLFKLGLKGKINLLVIFVGIISTAITATVTGIQSKNAIDNQVESQLHASAQVMKANITDYFAKSVTFTNRLTTDRLIEGLFIAFEGGFYGGAFKSDQDNNILNKTYLANDKLYGDRTRKIARDFGLKSILLASVNGQVVMNSQLDKDANFLGRHLTKGSLQKSALTTCYQNALDSKDNKLFFADFQFYKASGAVHSFLCKKMLAEFDHEDDGIYKGDVLGVVISEIDVQKINSIVAQREGMGDFGQFYIVGQDNLLRSDLFIDKKKFNYQNSVKNKLKLNEQYIKEAVSGKTGITEALGPNGYDVLAYYDKVNVFGKNWAFIAEMAIKEVRAPIYNMLKYVIAIAFITLGTIVVISLFLSKALSQPISKAVDSLQGITNEVFDNASNMKSYSSNINDLSGNMASSIQETMSTMDELTQMVNKNVHNVTLSAEYSESSKTAVSEGLKTIDDLNSAFNEINLSNEGIAETISETSKTMADISDVIKSIAEKTTVINDIVFQTKLLSFNASVEAARAGEHGKGFSVVAEEVGNLAVASGKAAIEISNLVSNSVSQVESIVETTKVRVQEVTEEGQKKVQKGNQIAQICGDKLKAILVNVNNVGTAIEEVKLASNEQSIGIQEVSKAMSSLNIVSNNSSELSTDILHSSSTLDNQSKVLENVVKDLDDLLQGEKNSSDSTPIFEDKDFDDEDLAA